MPRKNAAALPHPQTTRKPLPPPPQKTARVSATRTAPAAPRAVEAAPPALSLHQAGPLAVLRIHDLSYSSIVSVIAQALPSDVQSLMLVTPTDTKMFNLKEVSSASNHLPPANPRVNGGAATIADNAAAVTEEDSSPDFDSDPQAEALRLAAEGDAAAQAAGLEEARATANSAETPAERREALKQLRRAEGEAGQDARCGRCRGVGQIGIAMPDGGTSTTSCPVCQGKGTIRRYGAGRR